MTLPAATRISVLIVDDQKLFREGLRTVLGNVPDLTVVGEAAEGADAVRMVQRLAPDVVLMDLRMAGLDGMTATRQIRECAPQTRVIALTTFDDEELVYGALRAGAVGYLLKDADSSELTEAIRAAARGESLLDPAIAAKVIAEFARMSERVAGHEAPLVEPISKRELDVLSRLAAGSTNREIADSLYIAEGTVKNHITSILAKLGVRDRTQAALKARDLGLI